jgi:hypothetical protein
MKKKLVGKYSEDQVEVTGVYGDLTQEIIKITSDRLRLLLSQHLGCLERRRDWIAPAGILATLLVGYPATVFRDWILSADIWRALFLFITLSMAIWLVVTLARREKAETLHDLIEIIKRGREESPDR